MASDSGNNSNNLLTQFEKSYAEAMATLTQEDTMYEKSPDTMKAEVDTKVTQFIDAARQMETFFLQKQFLLYAHKPELHLRAESNDLRQEIARKDELIKNHNERLDQWLKMLQDLQQQGSNVVPNAPLSSPSSALNPAQPKGFPSNQARLPGSPIPTSTPSASAAGPLQFLEKTTTSIGNSSR